jgi:predicted nucleic acid-binding protein
MMTVVLDADVISFLFKNDSRAQAYLPHLRNRSWLLSFMTEAELEQWALLSNWQAKRIDWLRVFLGRFAIMPSSHDLVLKWAKVMVVARRNGEDWKQQTPGSPRQLLYDAPLVTHNASD